MLSTVTPKTRSVPCNFRFWGRWFGFVSLLSFGAWLIGFVLFAQQLQSSPSLPLASTDVIVVLTGGPERLMEGLKLLAEGKAKHLFITGVHPQVSKKSLLALYPTFYQAYEDRISLGYQALNTVGNARETTDWMQRRRYTSLRLITANYHMPRSFVEFQRAMPNVKIIPHPIAPPRVKPIHWWAWPGTTWLLFREYNKYLAVLGSLTMD